MSYDFLNLSFSNGNDFLFCSDIKNILIEILSILFSTKLRTNILIHSSNCSQEITHREKDLKIFWKFFFISCFSSLLGSPIFLKILLSTVWIFKGEVLIVLQTFENFKFENRNLSEFIANDTALGAYAFDIFNLINLF